MKTTNIRVFALVIFTIVLSAAQFIGQPVKPAATPVKPPAKHPLDKGDFIVGFSPITKAQTPKKAMPKDEREAFQGIATALNSFIAMPRNIYINIDTCGEANAFYSSVTDEITFCYELIDQFEQEFKTVERSQAKVDEMVEDTIMQTLFHELGHCLIDVWDLPATGREEDAVDQLATILMLDGSAEGQRSTINAALEFDIASRDQDTGDLLFWDEHSFSKTRFFDMMCMVYGSDPVKNRNLVGPAKLPAERARRCETEFQRAERAWLKLLAPYVLD